MSVRLKVPPSASLAVAVQVKIELVLTLLDGEMLTEDTTGIEFETVIDASVKLPSTYPSFGVTRTVHTSPTLNSDDEMAEPILVVRIAFSYHSTPLGIWPEICYLS